jgi:hypothetical protein
LIYGWIAKHTAPQPPTQSTNPEEYEKSIQNRRIGKMHRNGKIEPKGDTDKKGQPDWMIFGRRPFSYNLALSLFCGLQHAAAQRAV